MTKQYFIKWCKCALIRAIKTMAQTAISIISVTFVITAINWYVVFYTSLLSGIVSILTSLAGLPEVENEN